MSGMGMTSSSSSLDRWGGGGASISMGAGSSMGGAMGAGVVGGRRSDAIVIRNLAMDTTWQMLKDRFNHVGDIKYAEMKDRGVGVIRFGSERDAERAVTMMNGQRIDGRNIQISFY